MKGELRPGDTIGVWTYSDALHTDFPMQVWRENSGRQILDNAMGYLRAQKYEKRPRLDKVLSTIGGVITRSQRITIIFILDGSEAITGTPFDADINALHKKFGREFRSQHVPFVTVLAARNGQFFDYTINTPGSITIPHTALAPKPAETNTPPPVVESRPQPQPQLTPPPTIPAAPPPPHKHIEIVMSGSAAAAHTNAPEAPAPAPPPVVLSNTPAAPPVVSEPTTASTPAPETNIAAAAPTPTPSETTALVAPSRPIRSEAPPAPAATPPVAAPAPQPAQAAPVTPQSAPPVAVTTAARFSVLAVALFIIAFSLLAIAIVLVLFLVRRGRGASTSLISQSMDRTR